MMNDTLECMSWAAEKAGLPTSPPYLSFKSNKNNASLVAGVSFASGGAGIFNGTDEAFVSTTTTIFF